MHARADQEGDEIAALREEVGRLRSEHSRYREEVDRELVRRAYRIGELEGKLGEASLAFQSSLSWKLTKPLRALKRLPAALRGG